MGHCFPADTVRRCVAKNRAPRRSLTASSNSMLDREHSWSDSGVCRKAAAPSPAADIIFIDCLGFVVERSGKKDSLSSLIVICVVFLVVEELKQFM